MPVRRLGRRALAAAASVVLSLLVVLAHGSAVADETYPPGPVVVQGVLSEQEVPTGTVVVMSGDGFVPGALLRVSVNGKPLRELTADPQGAFSTELRVLEVGAHSVAVTGTDPRGRVRIVQDPLTILAASSGPVADGRRSGSPSSALHTAAALLGGLGVVVLAAGALLVHRARGRRASWTP